MSRLKMPVDKFMADATLRKFPQMAYSLSNKDIFEEAVSLLYGKAFKIKMDLSKRMLFHCELCNKDMNAVESLESHCRSGTHQKNKDKRERENRGSDVHSGPSKFPKDSLQYKLERSTFGPIGLQMVEEYSKGGGYSYYKCILCGAHGKIDHMYFHIIGKKHTELYIKSAYKLQGSVLTAKERDHLRDELVKAEGVDASVIRKIFGADLFPRKWEADGRSVPKQREKAENRWPSPTPSCSGNMRMPWTPSPPPFPKDTDAHSPESSNSRMPGTRPNSQPKTWSSPTAPFRNRSPPPQPPAILSLTQLLQGVDELSRDTKEKTTQKYDLQELMTQFNFIVKSHSMPDTKIVTGEDAKAVIDMMFSISRLLHFITKSRLLDTSTHKLEQQKLAEQRVYLEKIMGNIKKRMEFFWNERHQWNEREKERHGQSYAIKNTEKKVEDKMPERRRKSEEDEEEDK